jgi:hypothetical protein
MQIVVAERTATRRLRALTIKLGALAVVASLAASCTSSRDPDASAPATAAATTPATSPPTAAPTTVVETTTTLAPTTTTSTTTTLPPTTTTAPLVTEGATVLVANATKVPGAAGRLTGELAAVGYHLLDATNAAGNEEVLDATKVYFLPAGEAVATGLATVLGVPLARMPTPAPITDATVGLGEATVLVMLGKDLAGKTPPGLHGR